MPDKDLSLHQQIDISKLAFSKKQNWSVHGISNLEMVDFEYALEGNSGVSKDISQLGAPFFSLKDFKKNKRSSNGSKLNYNSVCSFTNNEESNISDAKNFQSLNIKQVNLENDESCSVQKQKCNSSR